MKDEMNHPPDELLLRALDGEIPPAANRELRAHLSICAPCRQRWESMETVSAAVRAYGDSMDDSPGRDQRRALIAALETTPRGRAPRYRWAAVAAAVLAGVGTWAVESAKAPGPGAAARNQGAGSFIALPYSDQNLAPEGAVVLQVELPRTALLLAGMPVGDDPASGRVKAEVLVGADGLARGIRFIN